jgi:CRISPR-associated protein Csd2
VTNQSREVPRLSTKIDFAVILQVNHANPNGDPLNGNRPRTDYAGYGEISDVCLKRKLRDRLMEIKNGEEYKYKIFVQSEDRKLDDATSLSDRASKAMGVLGGPDMATKACKIWLDVRAFGQLFALKAKKSSKKTVASSDEEGPAETGVSIPIRGPVTVQSAFSTEPVDIASIQITKSVSSEGDGSKRGSDTMGMKHRVDRAVYVFFGSMNPQLAARTGFSDEDAEAIKEVLPRLFENDASSARPEGSMRVLQVIWWKHNSKLGQYSSARVHGTLQVKPDGQFTLDTLEGLTAEEIPGF